MSRNRHRAPAVFPRFSALLLGSSIAAGAIAATPAAAQTEAAQAEASRFDRAADTLPALLAEETPDAGQFAPTFIAAVPLVQVAAITAQLRGQYGTPTAIESKSPQAGGNSGTVIIRYERALVHFALAADEQGRIIGLRIVNAVPVGDSIAALTADLAALPGAVGWGLYRIDPNGLPRLLHGAATDAPMAVGSVFKLTILGAIDQRIASGRARWSDVVRLDRQTVPAGRLIAWPDGAPLTLYTLAAMMISESDNRATDVLLHHIGRERVEAFAREHGGLSGPNAFPLLSTLEATILKNPGLGTARSDWLSGDEATRRHVLARYASHWTTADVDMTAFAGGPADIDRIEWFASANSIAHLLGWFTRSGSDEARAILAINPGIPSGAASEWRYVGYKGGSEPGVMAMSLLLRGDDADYVASLAWNNPSSSVDDGAFAALAARAAALVHADSSPR